MKVPNTNQVTDPNSKLLLIDKPAGITSHDVVNKVREIFHTKKVGHAGTLDPFATGLLIIGIGNETKKLGDLSGLSKIYEASAKLGATSTTYDIEGEINKLHTMDYSRPTKEDIERVLEKFRGGYEQKAPLFSAKKIKGRKLYELAREGIAKETDRPIRRVLITQLEVLDYAWPILRFRVSCGTGTYIRSLADDIGHELGCGAYLTALRRTSIGEYSVDEAMTLVSL